MHGQEEQEIPKKSTSASKEERHKIISIKDILDSDNKSFPKVRSVMMDHVILDESTKKQQHQIETIKQEDGTNASASVNPTESNNQDNGTTINRQPHDDNNGNFEKSNHAVIGQDKSPNNNESQIPTHNKDDTKALSDNDDDDMSKEEGEQLGLHPPKITHMVEDGTMDNIESFDMQEFAHLQKKSFARINKKCTEIANYGILLAVLKKDPLQVFAEPVPRTVVGYHASIKDPMDFSTIRRRVLQNLYKSVKSLADDVRLLCDNAMVFNPPLSIYFSTAKSILVTLEQSLVLSNQWKNLITRAHTSYFMKVRYDRSLKTDNANIFSTLQLHYPLVVKNFEQGHLLRSQLESNFIRTEENEVAYYGSLAIRRAACAAKTSLSLKSPIMIHRTIQDEKKMKAAMYNKVVENTDPKRMLDEIEPKEHILLKLLTTVQNHRIRARVAPESGCARCDDVRIKEGAKLAITAEFMKQTRKASRDVVRHRHAHLPRVDPSRKDLATGMASRTLAEKLRREDATCTRNKSSMTELSVRGSAIHGWGLFADRSYAVGDVVAEYIGEYVNNRVADVRERMYRRRRIQDYQFRVDADLVIDATLRGNHARYINHSCDPNSVAKIIDGDAPDVHLKRVVIYCVRNILPLEEITYDYQFPLEDDLDARIVCLCKAERCRGFMNWDLPETVENIVSNKIRDHTKDQRGYIVGRGATAKKAECCVVNS
uniref:[histone H3]-lysine(4) N-trimethyltransferase n=1 Tax=Corethron hystrix TaxID=216773 RepID=A0A7S1BN14_9STRA